MRQAPETRKSSDNKIVKDVRQVTGQDGLSEGKIRTVLDGLRGQHSIAELCRLRTKARYIHLADIE